MFDRAFHFFDGDRIGEARLAWKALADRDRHRTPLLEAERRRQVGTGGLKARPSGPSMLASDAAPA